MVAIANRAKSHRDRVELVGFCSDTGLLRWRMAYMRGELWLDARLVAIGMPGAFAHLPWVMEVESVTEVEVDSDGVLIKASEFGSPDVVEAAVEIFALQVAALGEAEEE